MSLQRHIPSQVDRLDRFARPLGGARHPLRWMRSKATRYLHQARSSSRLPATLQVLRVQLPLPPPTGGNGGPRRAFSSAG